MVRLQLLREVPVDPVYVDRVDLALDYLEVLVLAQQLRPVDCDHPVVQLREGLVDGAFVDVALVDHLVDVLVGPEEVVQHEAHVGGELDVLLVADLEGLKNERFLLLIFGEVVGEVIAGHHLAGSALISG